MMQYCSIMDNSRINNIMKYVCKCKYTKYCYLRSVKSESDFSKNEGEIMTGSLQKSHREFNSIYLLHNNSINTQLLH